MRDERPDHPLQTTALVHGAYPRLIDVKRVDWESRTHFFAVSAQMMRRLLVEAARKRNADERGGSVVRVRGSHHFLKHADGRSTVVPAHPGETIGPGLTTKILRDCDLTPDGLLALL